MGKILYLECATGVSADMVVGALLDLGANEAGLRRALSSLDVAGFEVRVSRKTVGALSACDFDVVLDAEHDGHDHDMHYLYGHLDEPGEGHGHGHKHKHKKKGKKHKRELTHEELHAMGIAHEHVHVAGESAHAHAHDDSHEHLHGEEHGHSHEHLHGEEHEHTHEHAHGHGHGGAHAHDHLHHHEHRSPADIAAIIDHADLAPRVKVYAHRIFDIVAAAEAKAHGVPVEEVLFHEVGAVDSIVDVVAAAYCLDDLDVMEGVVSALAEGCGRVRTAHGVLPIPVPAVANIVAAEGLVLAQNHREGEFVTPTGAAIAAAVRTRDALPERYAIKAVGIGSGKRAYDPPSMVRAMIVEEVSVGQDADVQAAGPTAGQELVLDAEAAETSHEASRYATFTPHLWKLETEMDDVTGEALGAALDKLYAAGALEAHYVSVYMKKNRPGYQIEVLCAEDSIPAVEAVLFAETTTIGIRRYPLDRTALPRERVEVQTAHGPVAAKRVTLPDGIQRTYPEFSEVERIAEQEGIAYQDAWQAAVAGCVG